MAEDKSEKNIKKIKDPLDTLAKIIKFGQMEKEVEVTSDFKIILSTLSSEDETEVFENCSQYAGLTYLNRNKIETLCYSILGVNGQRFDYDTIEDDTERRKARKDVVDKMRTIICKWRDEVITYVYEQFLKLTGNSDEYLKKVGIIATITIQQKLDEMQKDQEDKTKETKAKE